MQVSFAESKLSTLPEISADVAKQTRYSTCFASLFVNRFWERNVNSDRARSPASIVIDRSLNFVIVLGYLFLMVLTTPCPSGAGRARTDDDGIMSVSNYGSTRVLMPLLSSD